MMAKYSVGDWVKDKTARGSECFWRITKVWDRHPHGYYSYDIAFIKPSEEILGIFRHWGDRSSVREDMISPITDFKDILLCRAMELQEEYQEALKKIEKLKMDIEALSRVRGLL